MALKSRDPGLVTASEIASYAFCPEAWRLGVGLGLEANNEPVLARGERIHATTAAVEERFPVVLQIGFAMMALSVVVLGIYLFFVGR